MAAANAQQLRDLLRTLPWPSDGAGWMRAVTASRMVGMSTEARRPFVARPVEGAGPLLLTHRMAREEELLAAAVAARASRRLPVPQGWDATVQRLFGDAAGSEAAAAVHLAARRALAIVTGGPGTGKTWSIRRLIAALLLHAPTGPDGLPQLSVRLAAPTGKAAARMAEAMAEGGVADLPAPVGQALLSLRGETLHRMVGLRPDGSVRHDRNHPLPADLVVVDEASMVDLSLMRRLFQALPDRARLVLLGDPDQLPSVEAGRVLADCVASPALADCRVSFTVSYRFADAPGVAHAAACLQSGTSAAPGLPDPGAPRLDRAVAVLTAQETAPGETNKKRMRFVALTGQGESIDVSALAAPYAERYLPTLAALPSSPDEAALRSLLTALDDYRVLTVLRRGSRGVESLDPALTAWMRGQRAGPGAGDRRFWHGRPVMVTVNAPEVGLFNGDVGIVLHMAQGPTAVFAQGVERVRRVPVSRLPPHEGALAMTVHKSQGSQFRHVALVLAGRESPIQTRELVYTGLTRARKALTLWGAEDELRRALVRQNHRYGTLQEQIALDMAALARPGAEVLSAG